MAKHRKEIIINWEAMGALLAELSDNEQGEFFNGFLSEINHFPSHFAIETQMLSIRDKLTPGNITVAGEYLPAMWYSGEKVGVR